MLTAADADIVRRESALPGLATVLDPDRLAEALRPLMPEIEIGGARVEYLRYKPREDCRAACRLETRSGEIAIGVQVCRPERLAAWDGHENGGSPRRLVLNELALIVMVFPDDPKLRGLAPIAEPATRPDALRALLPHRPELWGSVLVPLRYRPQRRFTGQLRSGARTALVKSYTRKAFLRSRTNACGFSSRGALRVASLLGASELHRLLAFEWIPGRPLRDVCREEGFAGRVALAGAALAELHAQDPGGLPHWSRDAELADLRSIEAELAFLAPALSRRVEAVGARIARRLASAPPRHGAMHGDFSPNQVLVEEGVAAIIDLDLACRGDVADDLGNFLAYVERLGLHGELANDRVASIREALLDGYARAAGSWPADVPLYAALQLFRRARFPFRAREPQWAASAIALIDRASEILSAAE